jgi:hypothetical protein
MFHILLSCDSLRDPWNVCMYVYTCTSQRKPGVTLLVWLKAMILFHMTLNLNVYCLNYFIQTFGMLMNHPPFTGAEGPKTTDLGCCVQRQSCDVRKGCQWPQTCFFFKPLLCVGTKAATPRHTTGVRLSHKKLPLTYSTASVYPPRRWHSVCLHPDCTFPSHFRSVSRVSAAQSTHTVK